MRPVIFPYNIGSQGARALARQLNTVRVRRNGRYVPRRNDAVINWGNSEVPRWRERIVGATYVICNHPARVAVASDKLRTFQVFRAAGIPHPAWTTNRTEAEAFFTSERSKVVCRSLLRASEGRGITVAETPTALIPAPLYVKYWPKTTEYRVHVFRGEVIDVAQKRLRNGERERVGRNRYVRSHSNGWIFARENVDFPRQARELALSAVRSLGLDFGAVDLAVNSRGEYTVFEVNTAPGLEGQTVGKYANAVRRFCNG